MSKYFYKVKGVSGKDKDFIGNCVSDSPVKAVLMFENIGFTVFSVDKEGVADNSAVIGIRETVLCGNKSKEVKNA